LESEAGKKRKREEKAFFENLTKSKIDVKGDEKIQCVVCDEKVPGKELEQHYDEVHGWKLKMTAEDPWISFEEVPLIDQPKLLREWSHD